MSEQPTPSRRAGLRGEIAAALEAADYRMDMRRGDLADAVLPVLYREWPWLRAEAEDAPPPADRGALRDRIAEALREHFLCTTRYEADADGNLPCRCGDWREPGAEVDDENDWDSHLADVALAVLPAPADRAAVLREAADALDESETLRDLTDDHMHDVHAAANELRRMADEAQQEADRG